MSVLSSMSMGTSKRLLQSSCCIQVIQELNKNDTLKARVIGNSKNHSILEYTKDVAKKYCYETKLGSLIVKKNTCNDPLLCSFVCDTIYTENYNSNGEFASIKVEKTITP